MRQCCPGIGGQKPYMCLECRTNSHIEVQEHVENSKAEERYFKESTFHECHQHERERTSIRNLNKIGKGRVKAREWMQKCALRGEKRGCTRNTSGRCESRKSSQGYIQLDELCWNKRRASRSSLVITLKAKMHLHLSKYAE